MMVSNRKTSPLMTQSDPMARAHWIALSDAVPEARVDSVWLKPSQAQMVLIPRPR